MGAVAPPWASIYSSKLVYFCWGGRRLMSISRVSSRAVCTPPRPLELPVLNWAKMFPAVSYTTEKPCSDTVRAMQADRKVLPSPARR